MANSKHSATMQDILEKKKFFENDLRSTEKQIFELETGYLEETWYYGNIIKGWDGFLQNKGKQNQITGSMKKPKLHWNDRIFSASSHNNPNLPDEDIETVDYNQSAASSRSGKKAPAVGKSSASKGKKQSGRKIKGKKNTKVDKSEASSVVDEDSGDQFEPMDTDA